MRIGEGSGNPSQLVEPQLISALRGLMITCWPIMRAPMGGSSTLLRGLLPLQRERFNPHIPLQSCNPRRRMAQSPPSKSGSGVDGQDSTEPVQSRANSKKIRRNDSPWSIGLPQRDRILSEWRSGREL